LSFFFFFSFLFCFLVALGFELGLSTFEEGLYHLSRVPPTLFVLFIFEMDRKFMPRLA
jgi:hypothetical protein